MKSLQRFLIVGLRESNAGKTTVARSLIIYLREKGVKACGFKPKAGNNIWYNYNIVYEALNHGRLYGEGSKLLKEASGGDLPEELINPIHRLWAIPPHNLKQNVHLPFFIVDRVTLWSRKVKEIVVVNDSLPFRYGREKLVAKLYKPNRKIIHIKTLKELNKIVDMFYDKAVELAHRKIAEGHDALVYESYADIALPWKGITDLDLVLAVHPGYIQAYDPDKYLSALNLSSSLLQEEKTQKVISVLKPVKTVKIPPYTSKEIIDGVKRKLRLILEGK